MCCLCVSLAACLSVCLFLCVRLLCCSFVCVCLFACLFVCLFVFLFVCLVDVHNLFLILLHLQVVDSEPRMGADFCFNIYDGKRALMVIFISNQVHLFFIFCVISTIMLKVEVMMTITIITTSAWWYLIFVIIITRASFPKRSTPNCSFRYLTSPWYWPSSLSSSSSQYYWSSSNRWLRQITLKRCSGWKILQRPSRFLWLLYFHFAEAVQFYNFFIFIFILQKLSKFYDFFFIFILQILLFSQLSHFYLLLNFIMQGVFLLARPKHD